MNLRVKEICKERGLYMENLAEMLGVTPNTLTRNINGNPTIETLQKIADALEVEIWELFTSVATTEELTALVDHKGQLYKASSIEELENIIQEIKSK